MFRAVEYQGFEERPELRRVAERATALLESEVGGGFHPSVQVGWRPSRQADELDLSLQLALPIGTSEASAEITAGELESPDEPSVRSRLRRVWLDALDRLLEYRKQVWEEYLRETAEV